MRPVLHFFFEEPSVAFGFIDKLLVRDGAQTGNSGNVLNQGG